MTISRIAGLQFSHTKLNSTQLYYNIFASRKLNC